ncbi:MAG: ABC transporter ATP-binding protein [Bacillota bacterium]|nr:ABC transporter ATP-binding protein [Bacillota bacterium]
MLRLVIDEAAKGSGAGVLVRLAVLYTLCALAAHVLYASSRYSSEDIGWKATNHLRSDLLFHCLRLDMTFHRERTPGEMVERIDGDVNALANFFSQFVVGIMANLILLVGLLGMFFCIDLRVGITVTCFSLVTLRIMWQIRTIAIPHWAQVRQVSAEFYGMLGEWLSATEDIQANGAKAHIMSRFHQVLRRWYPMDRRASLTGYSLWMSSIILFAAGNTVALGLCAYLFRLGALTIGACYLIFAYMGLIRRPLERIRTEMQDLQKAGASIMRIEQLLARRTVIHDAAEGRVLGRGAASVAFDHISFAYDEGNVLTDVSFELKPGRMLGLLGRTGCGKTTVARLLFRLYDPTGGRMEIGGIPAQALRLDSLRERVGFVTQEVQLFNASLRDNPTFFSRVVADERLIQVIYDLGLESWYSSLPAGLDTVIGTSGTGLSAGQAQLVAFARLLLQDPSVVVLDEASSRLDPLTEGLLECAVSAALKGRTAIIIAHRLQTLRRADDILILDNGRVVEHGEREALASDPGSRFHQLLKVGLEEVLA